MHAIQEWTVNFVGKSFLQFEQQVDVNPKEGIFSSV